MSRYGRGCCCNCNCPLEDMINEYIADEVAAQIAEIEDDSNGCSCGGCNGGCGRFYGNNGCGSCGGCNGGCGRFYGNNGCGSCGGCNGGCGCR